MGKIDKEKIIEFFKNKRNIKIMVLALSVTIILLTLCFFWAIYTKDKPEFVPKETRGEIREGIKENIAKPIEETIPSIGKPIVDAAFVEVTASQNQANISTDTSKWQTYRNEELGYEVKYPENYSIRLNDTTVNMFGKRYETFQGEYPLIFIRTYPISGSDVDLNSWIDANKNVFIGDQDPTKVIGFRDRESFTFSGINGFYLDIETMGLTRSYVFRHEGRIIVFEAITLGDSNLLTTSEMIIANFK